MRIAIVINTSWNIFNFRMGLLKAFLSEGHEVIAIAPKDNYSERLKEIGCSYYPVKMDSRGLNPLKDLALIYELWSLYKKTKPDIILHFTVKPNIYGTLAASFTKIPVVNNVCGLGTAFIRKGLVTKIVYNLYKFSFRFSNKVFFQNWDDCKIFTRNGLIPKEKTAVIPGSGIDLAKFIPVKSEKKSAFTFLMVSRVIQDKGVLEYVDAIRMLKKKYPDAKFQLLGQKDPSHKHGINSALVDEWHNSGLLEYLGTAEDVRSFLADSDCVVLPSYREGTPRTLLEAASMAKPIITTNTTGCKDVVEDNYNGFLCKVRNSSDLALSMSRMMEIPEIERRQLGENGRVKMEKEFDEQIVIQNYLDTVRGLNS